MNRQEKSEEIGALKTLLDGAQIAVVADYAGLTVASMVELRSELRKSQGRYRVVKNTLAKIATQETELKGLHTNLRARSASSTQRAMRLAPRRRSRRSPRPTRPSRSVVVCSATGPCSMRRASKPSRTSLARTSCGRCCSGPSWASRPSSSASSRPCLVASCASWLRVSVSFRVRRKPSLDLGVAARRRHGNQPNRLNSKDNSHVYQHRSGQRFPR